MCLLHSASPLSIDRAPFILHRFVAYAVTNATLFRVFYSASGPADLFCWFPDSHKLGRVLAVHVYLCTSGHLFQSDCMDIMPTSAFE